MTLRCSDSDMDTFYLFCPDHHSNNNNHEVDVDVLLASATPMSPETQII